MAGERAADRAAPGSGSRVRPEACSRPETAVPAAARALCHQTAGENVRVYPLKSTAREKIHLSVIHRSIVLREHTNSLEQPLLCYFIF